MHRLDDEDVEVYFRLLILLYADDTVILAESAEALQVALNRFLAYCNDNNLKINVSKTNIVIFGRHWTDEIPAFVLGHEHVQVVNEYTYLGIIFHQSCRFTSAINKRKDQGRKALHSLLWKVKRLNLPFEIAIELFERLVIPVILYGAEIWGFDNIKPLEVFYKMFIKNLLGVHKSTCDVMVYGETGMPPLDFYITQRMIGFWLRLQTDRQSKYSCMLYKLCYKMHFDVNVPYSSKWIESVESRMRNLGLVIHDGIPVGQSANYLKNYVKRKWIEGYALDWQTQLHNSQTCSFYKTIKTEWGLADYLKKMDISRIPVIAKFRLRSNNLPCSMFFLRERPDLLYDCPICYEQYPDESHYLLFCPYFNNERRRWLPDVSHLNGVTEKVNYIFVNTRYSQLRKFCKDVMDELDLTMDWI